MKSKSRVKRVRSLFLSIVMLAASAFFVTTGVLKIKTTLDINSSIADDKEKSKELTEQLDDIKEEKTNLTNPEYLEYLARGKYLVSKSGEQVFKFPSLDDQESSESEDN